MDTSSHPRLTLWLCSSWSNHIKIALGKVKGVSGKLKIGLINVLVEGDYQFEEEIPLGMGAIGAFLRAGGYEVEYKQCFPGKGEEQYGLAAELEADIYGFQLNMVNYWHTQSVVKKIKSLRPDAITVFGGPYLVALSDMILKNEPLYDFAVIGEGELTALELVQALGKKDNDFSAIKGLVWRDNSGEIVVNEKRDIIKDLDTLSYPARDFLHDAEHDEKGGLLESVRIVTSRGCIANCRFCCVNLYNRIPGGKAWRGRSPKIVVDELEFVSKTYGAKVFNFSDSSFEDPGRAGKIRAGEICQEIIRRQLPISAKIYMRCETFKSEEDLDLLREYKKAGIDIVIPGVESGNDDELKFYRKNATREDNLRTLRILKDLDLFFVIPGFIMFGPNSTLETIKSNMAFLFECGHTDSLLVLGNVLMLLRDCNLYKSLVQEGRVTEDASRFWELPRYTFLDARVEKLSRHWQNGRLYSRFPQTLEVNDLQVNIGNLVARMTNPMNSKVLDALHDEFVEFKAAQSELFARFGNLQYEYFLETIGLVERDCSDEELDVSADDFFGKTYGHYRLEYLKLYEDFLSKIKAKNFSLVGLIFKAFHSAMAESDSDDYTI